MTETFIGNPLHILSLRDKMKNNCLFKCVFWDQCDRFGILKYKVIQLEFKEEKSWCPGLVISDDK